MKRPWINRKKISREISREREEHEKKIEEEVASIVYALQIIIIIRRIIKELWI